MVHIILTTLPADQAWGENEGMVVAILLAGAVVLTVGLGALFAYIIWRGDRDDSSDDGA